MLHRLLALLACVFAAVLFAGCSGQNGDSSQTPSASQTTQTPSKTLHVGAYQFPESQLVANLYAGALNAAGQPAEVKTLANREAVVTALEKDDIQVAGDYVGALTEFLNQQVNGANAQAVASADLDATMNNLRDLASQKNLVVLNPAAASNQNSFAVTKEFAKRNDLSTLTQLGQYSQSAPVVVGGPPECEKSPNCLPALEDAYDVSVSRFVTLDAGGSEVKRALREGRIDVGLVLSTDGVLDEFGLVILRDDNNVQPVDNIVPVLNQGSSTPEVDNTLNAVSAKLTQPAMQSLNYSVSWEEKDPMEVADAWLALNDLA